MAKTTLNTNVVNRVEVKETYRVIKGKFLWFDTEHLELVSRETISSDLFITMEEEPNNVYVNDKLIYSSNN